MDIDHSSTLEPFPAWSITLPRPLAFPRGPFAGALAEHHRLLAKHAGAFSFLARKLQSSFEVQPPHVNDLAAVIDATRTGPDDVQVQPRWEVAQYAVDYRGVLGRLLLRGEPSHMPVVVFANGAASLHVGTLDTTAGADRPRGAFVVEAADVVVEPLVQEHNESPLGPYLTTRWVHPDGESRYAWVPMPPSPATYEEAAERILRQYEALARQRLWAFLSASGANGANQAWRPLVRLASGPHSGDVVSVVSFDDPLIGDGLAPRLLPRIAAAIDRNDWRKHVPVFIAMGKGACLRWLEVQAEEDLAKRLDRPMGITEAFTFPLREAPPRDTPDDPANDSERRSRRRPSAAEAWVAIQRMPCFDAIDRYLAGMSDEEVDREVEKVGFDPERERTRGPGLRERVLQAIAARFGDDDPPSGPRETQGR
ncbi:MAG TPA: hypothetical protein VH044_08085 [Polyangiaceae bacterium]|jgi:hypothetical protein|nr:hypothetical protein [Polyangiaceae bacterium]